MQGERTRAELVARARAAAAEAEEAGHRVRYRSAIFVPEDETCFLVFSGPTAEAVRDVTERAGVDPLRIVQMTS